MFGRSSIKNRIINFFNDHLGLVVEFLSEYRDLYSFETITLSICWSMFVAELDPIKILVNVGEVKAAAELATNESLTYRPLVFVA